MPCITHSFFIKYQNIQSSECENNFTKLICQSAYNTTSLTGLHCHTVVSSKAFHYAQVLKKITQATRAFGIHHQFSHYLKHIWNADE